MIIRLHKLGKPELGTLPITPDTHIIRRMASTLILVFTHDWAFYNPILTFKQSKSFVSKVTRVNFASTLFVWES